MVVLFLGLGLAVAVIAAMTHVQAERRARRARWRRGGDPPCAGCGAGVSGGGRRCERCDAPHHRSCWQEANRCRAPGCALPVHVSGRDAVARHRSRIEARCPYCHGPLEDSASGGIAPCSGCGTRYHGDCLRDHACAVIGCDRKRPGRARARG